MSCARCTAKRLLGGLPSDEDLTAATCATVCVSTATSTCATGCFAGRPWSSVVAAPSSAPVVAWSSSTVPTGGADAIGAIGAITGEACRLSAATARGAVRSATRACASGASGCSDVSGCAFAGFPAISTTRATRCLRYRRTCWPESGRPKSCATPRRANGDGNLGTRHHGHALRERVAATAPSVSTCTATAARTAPSCTPDGDRNQ